MSTKFLNFAAKFLSRIGLKGFAELAVVIMAATGVITYAYDRIDARDTERRAASLTYLEKYRSGKVGEARRNLLILWIDQEQSYAFAHLRNTEDNKNKYIRDVIGSIPQGRNNLVEIAVFFDEVASCVEVGICDRSVVAKTLLEEMKIHFTFYAPIFCDIRERSRVRKLGKVSERVFFTNMNFLECR